MGVDASEGRKEVDQHQAHMHTDDGGALVIVLVVLVLVDGWLWRDNQGYRQMSHANPSGISLFLIGCLMTARRCRMEAGWNENNDG